MTFVFVSLCLHKEHWKDTKETTVKLFGGHGVEKKSMTSHLYTFIYTFTYRKLKLPNKIKISSNKI